LRPENLMFGQGWSVLAAGANARQLDRPSTPPPLSRCAPPKPPTYKNLPTTQLHHPPQVATQINSHNLFYVNYPNCANATSKNKRSEENQIQPTSVARLLAYFVVCPIKSEEDGFGDILGGKHREMLKLI
jgi:hypothetical protein